MQTTSPLTRLTLVCLLTATLAACSKKDDDAPSAEQVKAEKAAADKSVRDNAVWGEQVKALDKAKEVQKQSEEAAKKLEEATK